jgi:hypothetical protein
MWREEGASHIDEVALAAGVGCRLWRPRFLFNPNSWSTLLTMVKSRATWVLTSKTSPTNPNDPIDQLDTHVWSSLGQIHGQTLPKP